MRVPVTFIRDYLPYSMEKRDYINVIRVKERCESEMDLMECDWLNASVFLTRVISNSIKKLLCQSTQNQFLVKYKWNQKI